MTTVTTVRRIGLIAALLALGGPLFGQSQGALDAADNLVAMQRYHDAIEAIEKVLEKVPDDPSANAILGKAQFHLARFDDARKTFEKCRRVEPERFTQWTAPFLARLEFWVGNDEKAREYLAETPSSEFTAKGLPLLLDPPEMESKASQHYIVYVDAELGKKGADEFVATTMDRIHRIYSNILPFDTRGTVNRVYIFSDADAFQSFFSSLRGRTMGPSKSFYSENFRAILINADPRGGPTNEYGISDDALSSMFRTGFAQFRHLHVPNLPDWYQKGMGDYFAGSEVKGKKVTTGHVIRQDPRGGQFRTLYEIVKESVRESSYLPLSTLLTCSDDELNDRMNNRSLVNAAQAWSFVHFLLHDSKAKRKGRKLLSAYFNIMHEGGSRQEAYTQTFGKIDLSKLQEAWIDYVEEL